jgi:hypothetical protein
MSGEVCGGLPTRRYEARESSTIPLKIRTPEFAGRHPQNQTHQQPFAPARN